MKFNWKNSCFLLALSVSLFSCDEGTADVTFPSLEIPTTYESANYQTNAGTEITILSNLSALSDKIKEGRSGAKVSETELVALFNAGNPSLKSITTPYYAEKIPTYFAELAKSSGGIFNPTTAPTGNGGVYGGYLFDENGLELGEVIEKGLFGAALYNHALTVIKSNNLTANDIDRLVAIFGASPSFKNSDVAAQNPDIFAAKYAARRDKNDGNGFYTSIKTNLITAKAAIEKGQDYNQQRDKALSDFRYNWEKSNMATVINYLSSAISKLNKSNATDADKASALHSYSEAVGFMQGWKGVSQNDKSISDTQIDQLLELMNVAPNGTVTSYKLVTEPFKELTDLQIVIDNLKQLYKFTEQDIIDFDYNWVSEQGRK